jgi:hypothetical protein
MYGSHIAAIFLKNKKLKIFDVQSKTLMIEKQNIDKFFGVAFKDFFELTFSFFGQGQVFSEVFRL